MLKTDSQKARNVFRNMRRQNAVADHYISFIHTNFPNEEKNHYTIAELRETALRLGIVVHSGDKDSLYHAIRSVEGYQTILKNI